MAKDRLSMRKFKEVLRLKFDHHLTNRQIAKWVLRDAGEILTYDRQRPKRSFPLPFSAILN